MQNVIKMLTSLTFYRANLINKKPAKKWTFPRNGKNGNEDKMHGFNYKKIISKTIKFMEHASWRCKEYSVINNKLG